MHIPKLLVALTAASVFAVIGCATDGTKITDEHKQTFAKAAKAARDAHPDDRLKKLVEVCSTLSSCAGGCAKAMDAYVTAAPADRMAKMSSCKDLVKAFPDPPSPTDAQLDDWLWGAMERYAKRAGVTLPPRTDR